MGLDSAALTDLYRFLDFDERTDEAVVSDLATIQIYRLNDRHSLTEHYIDYSGITDDWVGHVANRAENVWGESAARLLFRFQWIRRSQISIRGSFAPPAHPLSGVCH